MEERNPFPVSGDEGPGNLEEWRVTATFEIKDADGRLAALHERLENNTGEKRFRWRRPNGEHGLGGVSPESLPLYGSERMKDWPKDALVVLVEGEKATRALLNAGVLALGTVTGAEGTPGPEALEVLRGHRVALWPDNDEAGREHMERIAEALVGVVTDVSIYEWQEVATND